MNSSANLLFVIYGKKVDDYTPIIYNVTCGNEGKLHSQRPSEGCNNYNYGSFTDEALEIVKEGKP